MATSLELGQVRLALPSGSGPDVCGPKMFTVMFVIERLLQRRNNPSVHGVLVILSEPILLHEIPDLCPLVIGDVVRVLEFRRRLESTKPYQGFDGSENQSD